MAACAAWFISGAWEGKYLLLFAKCSWIVASECMQQTLAKKAEIDWAPSISCVSWGEEARSLCMQTTWCFLKRGGKITQSMQTALCSSKRGGKIILVCKQQHQETNSTCEEQRRHLTEKSCRNTLIRLPGSHKTWTCWSGTSPLIRCGREWVQPRKFAQECGKEKLTVMDFDNQLPKNLIFVCSCPSETSRSPRIRHARGNPQAEVSTIGNRPL